MKIHCFLLLLFLGSCSAIQYRQQPVYLYRETGEIAHYVSDSFRGSGVEFYNGFVFFSSTQPAKRDDFPRFVTKDLRSKQNRVVFILRDYLSPVSTILQEVKDRKTDTGTREFLWKGKRVYKTQEQFEKNGVTYRATAFSYPHKFLRSQQDTPDASLSRYMVEAIQENWKDTGYFTQYLIDTILGSFEVAIKSFLVAKNNYLLPLQVLKQYRSAGRATDENNLQQAFGTFHSFAGNYKEARAYRDSFNSVSPEHTINFDYHLSAAKKAIYDSARNHDIVILNEDHMQPLHRRFADALLDSLYALGFHDFFVETLEYEDSALNNRGFPVQKSGYYSSEPAFGNMLRRAQQKGFQLHPYDSDLWDTEREIAQAQTIAGFVNTTGKKALVYCGFDHLSESPKDSMMGFFLKSFTGKDPLTVEQVRLTEQGTPTYEHALYRHIKRGEAPTKASIVSLPDSIRNAWFVADMQVVHPPTHFDVAGRPEWQFRLGGDSVVHLDLQGKKYEGMLLQIFAGEENESVSFWELIPMINVVLRSSNKFNFHLSKGRYSVYVTDVFRNIIYQKQLEL